MPIPDNCADCTSAETCAACCAIVDAEFVADLTEAIRKQFAVVPMPMVDPRSICTPAHLRDALRRRLDEIARLEPALYEQMPSLKCSYDPVGKCILVEEEAAPISGIVRQVG